jgi:AcrR family transcriptional regulator
MSKSKIFRPARSLSAKGRKTREALLQASQEVFCAQGYFEASVSEITRSLKVSQGTFYQYFSGKDQVLMELTDRTINTFWDEARKLDSRGLDLRGRLSQVIELLYDHSQIHYPFHRMLGELELIDPVTIAYFDSIARFYRGFIREQAAEGLIRPLDPNLFAYGLMGIVHFSLPDWGPELSRLDKKSQIRLTVDLLRHGINGPRPYSPPPKKRDSKSQNQNNPAQKNELHHTQGQRTRKAIFAAAERIFGRMGYNRASIADITREAGVAQGTFYVHFSSKLKLLEGVLEYLGRLLRTALSQVTKPHGDLRNAEREGMMAFYNFLREHRELYRVVAECEAIAPKAAQLYYTRLAKGYKKNLTLGMEKNELKNIPISFLVRSLMGFNHMIGLKWLIWNSSPFAEVPLQLAEEASELVIFGLDPSPTDS